MIAVFLVLFAIGGGAAFLMKKQYVAAVLHPGPAGPGIRLRARARRRGARRHLHHRPDRPVRDPDPAERGRCTGGSSRAWASPGSSPTSRPSCAGATPAEREKIEAGAIEGFGKNLGVGTHARHPGRALSYKDTDPQRAALVLNRLIDEYLIYRRTVLAEPSTSYLADQRRLFQDKLAVVDTAYQEFLAVERHRRLRRREGLAQRAAGLADRRELQGPGAAARGRGPPRRDGPPGERRARRDQRPPRHRPGRPSRSSPSSRSSARTCCRATSPNAAPVRDKDAQIAKLQAMAAERPGRGRPPLRGQSGLPDGADRADPALRRGRVAARARARRSPASSPRSRRAGRSSTELEPQYQDLVRDRDVLMANIKSLVEKEEQGQAACRHRQAHQRQHPHRRARHPAGQGHEPEAAGLHPGLPVRRLHRPDAGPAARSSCAAAFPPRPRRRGRWSCRCWPPRASRRGSEPYTARIGLLTARQRGSRTGRLL